MPVLISLGNGYMKMIDDGRAPDDPSGYRFLDVKSAPIEVKQEIMGEIDGLRGSIMRGGEAPPMPAEGKPKGMGPKPAPPPMPAPSGPMIPPGPDMDAMPPGGMSGGLPPELMSALGGGGMPPGVMPNMGGGMPPEMPAEPSAGYQRRGY